MKTKYIVKEFTNEQITIEDSEDGVVVRYNCSQLTRDVVFNRLIDWLKKYDAWSGESICQCDETNIESSQLIAYIVDKILQPKVTYPEDLE